MRRALVLFTCDLRVRDNPALAAAVAAREQVVPAFVLHEPWRLGAAERGRLRYPQPIVEPGSFSRARLGA